MGVFRNSMMIMDGLYPEKNLKPLQQWQNQTLQPQAQRPEPIIQPIARIWQRHPTPIFHAGDKQANKDKGQLIFETVPGLKIE